MKNRFTTLDVVAAVHDLRQFIGMRVANIYDVNSKTYLIKLQKPDHKAMIMFESGLYILGTSFDWEKSQFPSSFSMKLRKHVKQRRLESVEQLGVDRVVDLAFGSDESRVHVIVELYDRGNVLLTDHEHVILNILRPRTEKDTDVRLAVRNRYPVESARKNCSLPSDEELTEAVFKAGGNVQARRLLAPLAQFGGALLEHALLATGNPKDIDMTNLGTEVGERVQKLKVVLHEAAKVFSEIQSVPCRGFITFKTETNARGDVLETFMDYHPYRFAQCDPQHTKEFPTFIEAVDVFLSKMTSQKAEQKVLNVEREAMKKLENVKKDHEGRIVELEKSKERLEQVAERIIANKELVEKARQVILSALANQISWDRIAEMCKDATRMNDPVASSIVELRLATNTIVMSLGDPFDEGEAKMNVPIDLALNAFQNSKKLFVEKKAAKEKITKTVAASSKALKSAEAKAKATMDGARIRTDVSKSRKIMWFEKFLWFISRDGLVVIAGRDAQQNELLVKRYLRTDDIYVHADVRGAASVIIRNVPVGGEIPPKTLTEAAQMAVCYSNAWDAKVVASAWWVCKDQVSRTAPTGEYLTPGSFMIRGKKNFMPASQLVMGLGIMFKLDEESVERRREEKNLKEEMEKNDKILDEAKETGEGDEEEVPQSEEDEEDDDEEEKEDEFPDVQVPMALLRSADKDYQEEYTIINVGPSKACPAHKKAVEAARREKERLENEKAEKDRKEKEKMEQGLKPLTKRQKHKNDKIKHKYGDQDEEEREMRMALLGSRGKQKQEEAKPVEEVKKIRETRHEKRADEDEAKKVEEEEDVDKEKDEDEGNEEQYFLEQLTGNPSSDDTLMYAVACVAPYQALADFKYKVKLIPGTNKRGKAAKSAVELFLRSKTITPREESLLRALQGDEATARNIPGKVRVSAPLLHKK